MARIVARAPRRKWTGRNTGFLLQSARSWNDIVAAVGLYDVEARDAAAQAARAEFGFAAGYGLLFISIGLLFVVDGRIAGLLGAGAAVADALENSAILKALGRVTSETPHERLSPSPAPFSRVKWTLAGAASMTTVLLAI
jgi:hypothetical protein